MSDQNKRSMPTADKLSRRKLMQSAAALAGGTAAAALLPVTATTTSEARAAAKPSMSGATIVSASSKKNIVETDSGKVFGFNRNGIVTFKGIPYGGVDRRQEPLHAANETNPVDGRA